MSKLDFATAISSFAAKYRHLQTIDAASPSLGVFDYKTKSLTSFPVVNWKNPVPSANDFAGMVGLCARLAADCAVALPFVADYVTEEYKTDDMMDIMASANSRVYFVLAKEWVLNDDNHVWEPTISSLVFTDRTDAMMARLKIR